MWCLKLGKMFPFITGILNPLCGKCDFDCEYCWAKIVAKLYNMKKYTGPIRIDEKLLKHPKIKGREIRDDDFIFFVDMLDLFSYSNPVETILKILNIPKHFPNTKFLLLTKRPSGFATVLSEIPSNCYLGATIESNRYYPTVSKAPDQMKRLASMEALKTLTILPLFVCIEPILDFDFLFVERLIKLNPCMVAVGYDNYNHKLPEPPLKKTEILLKMLEDAGIKVYRKTIRRAWYET